MRLQTKFELLVTHGKLRMVASHCQNQDSQHSLGESIRIVAQFDHHHIYELMSGKAPQYLRLVLALFTSRQTLQKIGQTFEKFNC